MTNREFFNAIITGTVTLNAGKESEISYPAYTDGGTLIDELKEFAQASIEKLDKKNEAAKGKDRAKKPNPENEALKARLLEGMNSGEKYTAKWAAEYLGDDISTQKTSALLRQMVEAGTLAAVEVKKGATKEYTLA